MPAPAATEPEGGPDTGAPAKVESTGSKTLTEPHEPTAEALKVETPPAESKPSPQAVPSQLATAPEKADPAPAPSPPEIKAVAAEPKVETVPAQSKPARGTRAYTGRKERDGGRDAGAGAGSFIARRSSRPPPRLTRRSLGPHQSPRASPK